MPTEAKLRWIAALADAGLGEIEVASFVSPHLLPQMADATDVVRRATRIEGSCVLSLVPNLRGALRAIEAGAHKMTIPASASRAHSQANIRKSPEEAVAEVRNICSHVGQLPEGRRLRVSFGWSRPLPLIRSC